MALAARQFGVVTRRQLLDAGLTSSAIGRRIDSGHLLPVHAGVYAAGHLHLTAKGWWMADVLASGTGAALSHRAAAAHLGLRAAWRDYREVSVPRRGKHLKGVIVHRPKSVDWMLHDGIPVTTVGRTIVDLADVVGDRALRAVLEQAEILRLDAHVVPIRGRRGYSRLCAALAAPFVRTRSDLEIDFLELCRGAGLPVPDVNTVIEGMEVDFAWPACRLAVEVDGWETHGTRTAFQRDRRRGAALALAGWTLLRFTHEDVVREPGYVISVLGRFVQR